MNQVFIGALIPFLTALLVYAARRGRASLVLLIATPLFMAAGVLIAIFPDIPRLLGRMDLYHKLAKDPRSDFFFWHHSIDLVESDVPWYNVGIVFMALCLIVAAWRELRRSEEE